MEFVSSCLAIDRRRDNSINAFTLIELLGVMATVLILVGVSFGVSRGVLNQQARSQAKAELKIIGQALEEFKLTYGDYPWVSEEADPTAGNANAEKMTLALTGFAVFEQAGDVIRLRNVTSGAGHKWFIDPERLSFSHDFGTPFNADDLENVFLVDPWGQPYVFVYNKGVNSWDNIGYVLFSKGPDGRADIGSIVSTGIIGPKTSSDMDNIYPGE